MSLGHYTTGSSAISPMPSNRYTHIIEKTARPSLNEQINRGRSSFADQANIVSKGYITPMASNSRQNAPNSDGRNVRASSAERALALVSKGPKKDNRPLSDKNYQNEMLSKIDNYFHCIGQSAILNNNGSLKPLTLKIFVEATNLLIKLLDVKQSFTAANYVEEIPKIAKKVHYPGLMNKSWLKTANTMHSWPHAIGWLSWLVELCEVKDLASEIFTIDRLPIKGESEEERKNHRIIFFVMIKCYVAWNEERPEEEDRIMNEFFEEELARRGIGPQIYDEVNLNYEKHNAELQKQQAKTREITEEVNKLQETINNMKIDRAKQQEHILEQEKYIEKKFKKIDELCKDSQRFHQDVQELETINKDLYKAIKQQPMSAIERDEILKACSEQQTYIQNFEAHLKEIKKESFSLDIRLVSTNDNLVKTILAYNGILFKQFSDSKIILDKLLMPENGICESNFMDRIENKKILMNDYMQEQSEELHKKSSLLESHFREIEAMQTKREALSEKMEKRKATEEKKKQEIKCKEKKKKEEIKKLQAAVEELNELSNTTSTKLDVISQQLTDSIDKREAVHRKNTHIRDSAKRLFMQIDTILDDHRKKIRKVLEIYEPKN